MTDMQPPDVEENRDEASLRWKFYVFMFNEVDMVTTYGKTEEDARLHLGNLSEANPTLNLSAEKANLLFWANSPVDLDSASDEIVGSLCNFVLDIVHKNDRCNKAFGKALAAGSAIT